MKALAFPRVGAEPHGGAPDLRTRASGRHRFVDLTVRVPADWTVRQAHAVADDVETAIRRALPDTGVRTHLEPLPDVEEPRPA